MTTVAYRAGIIAADTGMVIGETRVGETRKIAQSEFGLVGGAGNAGFVAAMLRWFEEGEAVGQCPKSITDEFTTDRAIIIRPDKPRIINILEDDTGWFEVEAEYYVLGTGREVALGAFWKKATAVEAVQAAMQHDNLTWGRVMHFGFSKRQSKGLRGSKPSRV